MTMSTSDVLKAAKQLIENPEHWTQGNYAKDVHGDAAPITEYSACRWCTAGAIIKVDTGGWLYNDAMDTLEEFTFMRVTLYNDTHTHAEVMEVFDKAIKRACGRENSKLCK